MGNYIEYGAFVFAGIFFGFIFGYLLRDSINNK